MGAKSALLLVRAGLRRSTGALAAAIALLLPGACRPRGDAPDTTPTVDPRRHDAFFLWAGVMAPPYVDRARTVYLLDGEVRAHGPPRFVPLRPQAPHLARQDVWLTIRLEWLDWDDALFDRALSEIDRWEAAGTHVAGLTLDFDARTRGLATYASFLRQMRQRLPQRYRLSVTGLMDWGAHGDPLVLEGLRGVIDEAIFQTYQGRQTIPGYERYIARLGQCRLPFRVALVEGGQWRAPPSLAGAPGFRGYVVFLLPHGRTS